MICACASVSVRVRMPLRYVSASGETVVASFPRPNRIPTSSTPTHTHHSQFGLGCGIVTPAVHDIRKHVEPVLPPQQHRRAARVHRLHRNTKATQSTGTLQWINTLNTWNEGTPMTPCAMAAWVFARSCSFTSAPSLAAMRPAPSNPAWQQMQTVGTHGTMQALPN